MFTTCFCGFSFLLSASSAKWLSAAQKRQMYKKYNKVRGGQLLSHLKDVWWGFIKLHEDVRLVEVAVAGGQTFAAAVMTLAKPALEPGPTVGTSGPRSL